MSVAVIEGIVNAFKRLIVAFVKCEGVLEYVCVELICDVTVVVTCNGNVSNNCALFLFVG